MNRFMLTPALAAARSIWSFSSRALSSSAPKNITERAEQARFSGFRLVNGPAKSGLDVSAGATEIATPIADMLPNMDQLSAPRQPVAEHGERLEYFTITWNSLEGLAWLLAWLLFFSG
jgi:hypothetical protein